MDAVWMMRSKPPKQMKIRFHATRGSMSVGESKGGLPPDRVVKEESNILHDTRRLIETYHRPQRYSMMRVGVAPCSPFSVSRDLMQESAHLARTLWRDSSHPPSRESKRY
jgi:cytosine/adenosine deaminase-related metal-dependent hydrolase